MHARNFCSKACKTAYQWQHDAPPINNYRNGIHTYRAKALKHLPHACARCGFDECPEILEAHHKDGDRMNNMPANLEVLCPTCHRLHHFRTRTGPWGVPGSGTLEDTAGTPQQRMRAGRGDARPAR